MRIAGQHGRAAQRDPFIVQHSALQRGIAAGFDRTVRIVEVGGIDIESATGTDDSFRGERAGELVVIDRLAEIAGRIPGIGGAGVGAAADDLVDDEIPRRIVRVENGIAVCILRHSVLDPIIDRPDFSRPVRGGPGPGMIARAVGEGRLRPE